MARQPNSIDTAYANTLDIYARQAEGWDAHRVRVFFEKHWLDSWLGPQPAGLSALDLGCGAGDPIGRYLIERGVALTGIDAAEPMLEIARRRCPNATWIKADMREYEPEGRFDRILSWDGSFHLTEDEQRLLLDRLPGWLNPDGALLLTIGHKAGETTGMVEGETVYHASLDPEEYRQRLDALGFQVESLILEEPGIDYHSLILARKR